MEKRIKHRIKHRIKMDLQLFAEEDPGVEDVSAAEVQETPEFEADPTGVDDQAAAEPEKQNNYEKAFAKRLSAEREKWQKENEEKYKDYEVHKEISEYLQQVNGADALTLKETIELERLQNRAEQNEISPEMQQRLEALEAKAAKADELENKQQEEARVKTYFDSLNIFVKDKGIESDKLNQFMIENELSYDPNNPDRSFNLAYKAMRADELEQKLASAKEDAVKEYLQSKNAPRVEGSGTPGVVHEDTSKLSFSEITQRAAARIRAANQAQ